MAFPYMLDGKVMGECKSRHRAEEFVGFLHTLDRQTPSQLDVHLIVDNSSTHKTAEVKKWLARHP
jgi:hypothetical protein